MDIRFKIEVNGADYPCCLSMGAMQDFKRRHGHEVHEADDTEVLDIVFFCAYGEAVRSGNKLPFDVNTFGYLLSPVEGAAVIEAYTAAVIAATDQNPEQAQKKTTKE